MHMRIACEEAEKRKSWCCGLAEVEPVHECHVRRLRVPRLTMQSLVGLEVL